MMTDLFFYNSAAWSFFNGPWDGSFTSGCQGSCQTNTMRVANAPENMVWYGIDTKCADTMVFDGRDNPSQSADPGTWGGTLAA